MTIWGENLAFRKNEYIKQTWKTSDFEDDQPYSILEVFLATDGAETKVTLKHSGLTEKNDHYRQGWIDNYFEPMKAYFES